MNRINQFRPTAVEVRHGQTKHMKVEALLTCDVGKYRVACGNRTVRLAYVTYSVRNSREYVDCSPPGTRPPCSYPPPMQALRD